MASISVQINVLVVDDDPTCLAIVAGFLQSLNHHVVAMKNPVDALYTLRMKYQSFDLILTDVHMPEMSGLDLLKHAEEEFKLPVVLMSADCDKLVMLKGLEDGAAFYFVKPIARDNLERLWQFTISASCNRTTSPTFDIITPPPNILSIENNNSPNFTSLLNEQEIICLRDDVPSSENPRNNADHDNGSNDAGPRRKKPKLVWTTSLHNQFLEAVNKIGLDKAVPKKILEYMNVPGLKRENVASHLQKYRIFLKRISEATTSMQYGVPNNWNERPFRSSFVLNEITFLTNNLQQQYQQLMSRPKGIEGQSSTQEKSSGDHNPNKEHAVSTGLGIEGTSCNGISSKTTRVENLQHKTNNYVGLRISSDGELFGTLKNTVLGYDHHDNGGDHLMKGIDHDNHAEGTTVDQDQLTEKPTYPSWDAPPNLFGIDDNVGVYIPNLNVDNNANQQEANYFGISQEMLSPHDLTDELRQIGIDINVDHQEFFGGDFFFGSYDMQSNASEIIEGFDQGIFDGDDVSLDYYFMQANGQENFIDFGQDGGDNNFPNIN